MRRATTDGISRLWVLLGALPFIALGCASYQTKVDESRRLFETNRLAAVEKLEPLANEESRDQLVYMLDYAAALQAAGRFEDSAKVFLRAEKLADLNDYHSISKVAASLALSEEMVQYKADDFEKVLIPSLNALNYLQLEQTENAMTQVRRVNEMLTKLRIDGKKDFNQSPYAYYLGALLYEHERDFDNALILYKKAYEVAPEYAPLKRDLLRLSLRAQRPDEFQKFKQQFPDEPVDPIWKDKKAGEVVLIFLNGWGPRKQPRPENHRFPRLVPVMSMVTSAQLSVETIEGVAVGAVETQSIYSIDDVAIKALDGDYGRLVASRVAGIATKAVLADQVRQKNEALGHLAWLAMNIADRADLRQWSMLPKTIQFARLPLKAGSFRVKLTANGSVESVERQIEIKSDRKAFVVWR
ncbi:MAG: hypothetical protein IPJ84_03140 [Bdellovibrionales bacterium]|nr:hypothetical protein [Bdellovibrionales bacterium]